MAYSLKKSKVGKMIGGHSAEDRLKGAATGAAVGFQTGGLYGALAGGVAGGAVGSDNIQKGISGVMGGFYHVRN